MPTLDREEEVRLVRAAQAGDALASAWLEYHHTHDLSRCARFTAFQEGVPERELDLDLEGRDAFHRLAVPGFELERGNRLWSYAERVVTRRLLYYIQHHLSRNVRLNQERPDEEQLWAEVEAALAIKRPVDRSDEVVARAREDLGDAVIRAKFLALWILHYKLRPHSTAWHEIAGALCSVSNPLAVELVDTWPELHHRHGLGLLVGVATEVPRTWPGVVDLFMHSRSSSGLVRPGPPDLESDDPEEEVRTYGPRLAQFFNRLVASMGKSPEGG